MITYADASEIVGALLTEVDDREGPVVLDGSQTIFMSEVATVEVSSALMAAQRAARIADGRALIATFESWCAPGGRIRLLELRPAQIIDRASRLTQEYRLYALDAIHLAVAIEELVPVAAGETVRFITRDRTQAEAARALGFTVDS
jgi:predicted nucleic acid-binding protein